MHLGFEMVLYCTCIGGQGCTCMPIYCSVPASSEATLRVLYFLSYEYSCSDKQASPALQYPSLSSRDAPPFPHEVKTCSSSRTWLSVCLTGWLRVYYYAPVSHTKRREYAALWFEVCSRGIWLRAR